jgi:hypothetical protein
LGLLRQLGCGADYRQVILRDLVEIAAQMREGQKAIAPTTTVNPASSMRPIVSRAAILKCRMGIHHSRSAQTIGNQAPRDRTKTIGKTMTGIAKTRQGLSCPAGFAPR